MKERWREIGSREGEFMTLDKKKVRGKMEEMKGLVLFEPPFMPV